MPTGSGGEPHPKRTASGRGRKTGVGSSRAPAGQGGAASRRSGGGSSTQHLSSGSSRSRSSSSTHGGGRRRSSASDGGGRKAGSRRAPSATEQASAGGGGGHGKGGWAPSPGDDGDDDDGDGDVKVRPPLPLARGRPAALIAGRHYLVVQRVTGLCRWPCVAPNLTFTDASPQEPTAGEAARSAALKEPEPEPEPTRPAGGCLRCAAWWMRQDVDALQAAAAAPPDPSAATAAADDQLPTATAVSVVGYVAEGGAAGGDAAGVQEVTLARGGSTLLVNPGGGVRTRESYELGEGDSRWFRFVCKQMSYWQNVETGEFSLRRPAGVSGAVQEVKDSNEKFFRARLAEARRTHVEGFVATETGKPI
jgi:hypothetical protein